MVAMLIGFAALATAGTLIRAVASDAEHGFNRHMYVTFTVNVIGSFLLGLLTGSDPDTITLVGVGGLGSLTTFSTYVSQIECIAREGKKRDAALYAIGSLLVGIAAAWLGWSLVI